MTKIGYHASHEQFRPSDLLKWVQLAERSGFTAAKCSDHFHPWSERQGQSGFAWSWLGAAMQATALPFGCISAPGYRYHPAVLAQSAATLGQMFPGRFWLSLGSGEAINESITGLAWPDKPERNARLMECVEVTRALLAGETVTHRGRITVVEAKLYSLPEQPVPIYGSAITETTARWAGSWADGLLIAASQPEDAQKLMEAFAKGGGAGKPVVFQAALCWAPEEDKAMAEALQQWSANAIGGEVAWDLRRPSDFDTAAKSIGEKEIRDIMPIGASLQQFTDWIGSLLAVGPAELHLHQVGRNQEEFVRTFGEDVLPQFGR